MLGQNLRGELHDESPRPGVVIDGKWELMRLLSTGGFGTVFEAWHLELGRFIPRSWPAALVLSLGCSPADDAPSTVVHTAHARLTTTADQPICRGTPVFVENELTRIAETLDITLDRSKFIDIRYGSEAVQEGCAFLQYPETAAGCTKGRNEDTEVFANDYTIVHEYVHAVRARYGHRAHALFEEGIAEVLSGIDGLPQTIEFPNGEPWLGPLDLLEIPRAEYNGPYYFPAKSFTYWLQQTQGLPDLVEFLDEPRGETPTQTSELFAEHFGLILEDAEAMWRTDERPPITIGAPCIAEHTYSLDEGPVRLEGLLDCEGSAQTLGAALGPQLFPMCLDVPANTRVRVSLDADHGTLSLLLREDCMPATPVPNPESYQDKMVTAGEALELEMAGCRWRMLFGSEELDPTSYAIEIESVQD